MLHFSNSIVLCLENEEEVATEVGQTVESAMKLVAVSTIQGYVSALKDYYTSQKQDWPVDLAQSLATMIAGHERHVARYVFK